MPILDFIPSVRSALVIALCVPCAAISPAAQDAPTASAPAAATTSLEQSRLTMTKWIETQQIIGKERNEWQQSKELLRSRVDLVAKEVAALTQKIKETQDSVSATGTKRDELNAQLDVLKSASTQLAAAVTAMEVEVRKLAVSIPDPVLVRLAPLLSRIPDDATVTRVSIAERFQNVLGILNEINKANSELTVHFEVRTLADGSSVEVQTMYVGLAQGYYISPRGDAGIGVPTATGWKWQPAPAAAGNILKALEILQGKHTPAFVPLPVTIQ